MQIHMRKLIEVTKDIDGFKEILRFSNVCILRIGECSDGRIKRKGLLQATYYKND